MPARDLRISAVLDTFVLPLDERGDWECILASAGVRGWGARRGSWTARRRLIVFAAALVGILVSTLTVAASEGWWFFRSGEAPKPISDVYVVKNGTWSGVAWTLTAYLSGTDGVCFAIGPTSSSSTNGTGAAMSCDQIAGVPRTATSKPYTPHAISYLMRQADPALASYIVGPVTEQANEVVVRLSGGQTLHTPTFSAPPGLDAAIRFYATQFPCHAVPREVRGLDASGHVVARLEVSAGRFGPPAKRGPSPGCP